MRLCFSAIGKGKTEASTEGEGESDSPPFRFNRAELPARGGAKHLIHFDKKDPAPAGESPILFAE